MDYWLLTGMLEWAPGWTILQKTPKTKNTNSILGLLYICIISIEFKLFDNFTFWNWPMLEKLSIFFQIDAKLNEKVMHSRMLQLFAFDWNAWMGSKMDHFAEIDKNQKHTFNTGTSLSMQLNFSYLKAQNTTINPIEVIDLSISQSLLMS